MKKYISWFFRDGDISDRDDFLTLFSYCATIGMFSVLASWFILLEYDQYSIRVFILLLFVNFVLYMFRSKK